MSDELIDVSEGVNVLLLGESGDRTERCCDALLDVGSAENRGELTVSFPEDVTDRARFDTGTTGRQAAKHGHVTVGDVLRSTERSSPKFDEPVATDIVEDPADLKGIGTSVSRFCEVWSESGHQMVLCFDSLSELLERRDPKVVFQFLHTLLERLASVETVAHFHLDPDRVDQQTVSTFGSLFDRVVDPADAAELRSASPDSHARRDAAGLVDESALEDEAETDDAEPSISDGIPATSGSSQASDGDIAARLDEEGEEYEVADGGSERENSGGQASDDDIAARLAEVDDDADGDDGGADENDDGADEDDDGSVVGGDADELELDLE